MGQRPGLGYTQHVAPLEILQVIPASEVRGHHLQIQVAVLCKQDPDPLASVITEESGLWLPASQEPGLYAGIKQPTP